MDEISIMMVCLLPRPRSQRHVVWAQRVVTDNWEALPVNSSLSIGHAAQACARIQQNRSLIPVSAMPSVLIVFHLPLPESHRPTTTSTRAGHPIQSRSAPRLDKSSLQPIP